MDEQVVELRLQLHRVSEAYHSALADYYAALSSHRAESLIADLVTRINAAGAAYEVAISESEQYLLTIERDERLEDELQRIVRLRAILADLQGNFQ